MDAMMVSESPAPYGKVRGFSECMSLEEFDAWYAAADETVHAEWANGEAVLKMPIQLKDFISNEISRLQTNFMIVVVIAI